MTPAPAPSAPSAPPTPDLQALQRAICARARDFEIGPLLDLLARMGYRADDVRFRGHLTEAPQPTLVHHIEFSGVDGTIAGPDPRRGPSVDLGSVAELAASPIPATAGPWRPGGAPPVTVTVNLGLLSCRSPLPSYFQSLLGDPAIREPLLELLQILDRSLLHARLTSERPDRLVARWDQITGDLLRIHGLDSLVGLGWLFRHVFPELPVTVERTAERLRVPYASARLGLSDLGSACFGATTRIDVHDFQVTLRCEESLQRPGVPWVREADRRLRAIVFPALDPVCLNLTIVLELEDARALAVLSDGPGPLPDSYLGVDPLGRPGAAGGPPRRVILYRGLLPRDQLELEDLEAAIALRAPLAVTVTAAPPTDTTATAVTAITAITAAPSAPTLGEVAARATLDGGRALTLALTLGSVTHHLDAVVRWGARPWFRDEPHAIELVGARLPRAAAAPDRQPLLWALLRDRARRALSDEVAAATLARYGARAVTDAMVADLIARGEDAALHALLEEGAAGAVPRPAWDRYLAARAAQQPTM